MWCGAVRYGLGEPHPIPILLVKQIRFAAFDRNIDSVKNKCVYWKNKKFRHTLTLKYYTLNRLLLFFTSSFFFFFFLFLFLFLFRFWKKRERQRTQANKRTNERTKEKNNILEELQSKLKFTITKLILFLKVQITRARKKHAAKERKGERWKKYRWNLLGMWTRRAQVWKNFCCQLCVLFSLAHSASLVVVSNEKQQRIIHTDISQARQLTNEVIQWLRPVGCMRWLVGWIGWKDNVQICLLACFFACFSLFFFALALSAFTFIFIIFTKLPTLSHFFAFLFFSLALLVVFKKNSHQIQIDVPFAHVHTYENAHLHLSHLNHMDDRTHSAHSIKLSLN